MGIWAKNWEFQPYVCEETMDVPWGKPNLG